MWDACLFLLLGIVAWRLKATERRRTVLCLAEYYNGCTIDAAGMHIFELNFKLNWRKIVCSHQLFFSIGERTLWYSETDTTSIDLKQIRFIINNIFNSILLTNLRSYSVFTVLNLIYRIKCDIIVINKFDLVLQKIMIKITKKMQFLLNFYQTLKKKLSGTLFIWPTIQTWIGNTVDDVVMHPATPAKSIIAYIACAYVK